MKQVTARDCRRVACGILFIAVGVSPAGSQTRDPRALGLVKQALAAMGVSSTINDVSIQASAAYTAGSDQESGGATLIARGNQESRVTLSLDGGQREEIRRGPTGAWIGPDGQAHPISTHNTWTDASWFFPALGLEAMLRDPQLGLAYIGEETRESRIVHRYRSPRETGGCTTVTGTI